MALAWIGDSFCRTGALSKPGVRTTGLHLDLVICEGRFVLCGDLPDAHLVLAHPRVRVVQLAKRSRVRCLAPMRVHHLPALDVKAQRPLDRRKIDPERRPSHVKPLCLLEMPCSEKSSRSDVPSKEGDGKDLGAR